jgi:hypothetical protein
MDHEHDHFHHRFVRNRFFFAGGGWPYYYDYGYDCGWLLRRHTLPVARTGGAVTTHALATTKDLNQAA